MKIGLKIKQLTESNKITVSEMSKILGKSRQTIYNMFEEDNVNTEILNKISSELGIPMSYFFDEDVNEPVKNNGESGKKVITLLEKHINFLEAELGRYRRREDEIYSKLGKYRGATTMNGVGFGILDYSDMAFRAN